MPDSFCRSDPRGDVFVTNGRDPVLRWDGKSVSMTTAGVKAPTVAPVMTSAGGGPIVGTYLAYSRFVDDLNNPSNLSPISAEFVSEGATNNITDASNETPIKITTIAHGLGTGVTLKISGVGGNTAANGNWTITVTGPNTFTLDQSGGNGDYNGGGTYQTGRGSIIYSNLPVPTEAKVVRRQILRNLDGEARTFYVDVDSNDLTATTYTTTRSDDELATQEAVPLLDDEGRVFANRYGVPPDWMQVACSHLGRMFMAVPGLDTSGAVACVTNSTTVRGLLSVWTASLAGRLLHVKGATRTYRIVSVDTVNQTLVIDSPWVDENQPYGQYAIRPDDVERNQVYYSGPGLPEAWLPSDVLSVQEDGDEVSGLIAKGAFMLILKKNHIYRFTYQKAPWRDGAVFLGSKRGCINQRCAVLVGDVLYCLDYQGIHSYGTAENTDAVSYPIQNLFRPDSESGIRLNWNASYWFHAVHYPPQEVIRWFVCLQGDWWPKQCLAYNYRLKRWWLESYHNDIGGSCSGPRRGVERAFVGAQARKVLLLWQGYLDGVDPSEGTTRGQPSEVTAAGLTEDGVTYANKRVIGSNLTIVGGPGQGQVRRITDITGSTIALDLPWIGQPTEDSTYQIGSVDWKFVSTWFQRVRTETMSQSSMEVNFWPIRTPNEMVFQVTYDNDESPVIMGVDTDQESHAAVGTTKDSSYITVNQAHRPGIVIIRMPMHKEYWAEGIYEMQFQVNGWSTPEPFALSSITLHEYQGSGGGVGASP